MKIALTRNQYYFRDFYCTSDTGDSVICTEVAEQWFKIHTRRGWLYITKRPHNKKSILIRKVGRDWCTVPAWKAKHLIALEGDVCSKASRPMTDIFVCPELTELIKKVGTPCYVTVTRRMKDA